MNTDPAPDASPPDDLLHDAWALITHMLTRSSVVDAQWALDAIEWRNRYHATLMQQGMAQEPLPAPLAGPVCGAWATPGCILPAGHHTGDVDAPENHLFYRSR